MTSKPTLKIVPKADPIVELTEEMQNAAMYVEPEKVSDILEKQPHLQGPAVCLACKHTWQAVAPVGTTYFECPECSLMKGVFNNICITETHWQCFCGNTFFALTGMDNIICAYCGKVQIF